VSRSAKSSNPPNSSTSLRVDFRKFGFSGHAVKKWRNAKIDFLKTSDEAKTKIEMISLKIA
jgi:hypothetical protein